MSEAQSITEAVRRVLDSPEAIEKAAKALESPLTMSDVLDRVPWSRPTVKKMVKRRQIPMVKRQGRWIISRKAFRKALRRDFEAPRGARTLDI